MNTKAQNCACGNRNVAWGSDRIENVSFLHCVKCGRYVEAATLAEAIDQWNAPSAGVSESRAATGGRISYGIY